MTSDHIAGHVPFLQPHCTGQLPSFKGGVNSRKVYWPCPPAQPLVQEILTFKGNEDEMLSLRLEAIPIRFLLLLALRMLVWPLQLFQSL